ncbi:putative ABC transporter ATP-binding protein YknY [Bacteroidaceae bacterium]|nr:putative ABC transporter ATP-binding protein YknY [Bacteroidaceae bacterium]
MMIKTEKMTKLFTTEEVQTKALNEVTLQVEQGEFVAIMGPSGCGKSTLLNILGTLDSSTSGSYLFEGKQVDKMNESQLTALRRGNIGFIFQSFNLIDELTVYENVELPLIYTGVKAGKRKEKVNKILEKVNMLHRVNHYPQQLSGGQQQRVAIARAIVTDCKLLLADEPTGNLDSTNGMEVMELLSELNCQGTTVIIVTHSQRDAMYAHRVIHLLDGQIISENNNRPLDKGTLPESILV